MRQGSEAGEAGLGHRWAPPSPCAVLNEHPGARRARAAALTAMRPGGVCGALCSGLEPAPGSESPAHGPSAVCCRGGMFLAAPELLKDCPLGNRLHHFPRAGDTVAPGTLLFYVRHNKTQSQLKCLFLSFLHLLLAAGRVLPSLPWAFPCFLSRSAAGCGFAGAGGFVGPGEFLGRGSPFPDEEGGQGRLIPGFLQAAHGAERALSGGSAPGPAAP